VEEICVNLERKLLLLRGTVVGVINLELVSMDLVQFFIKHLRIGHLRALGIQDVHDSPAVYAMEALEGIDCLERFLLDFIPWRCFSDME